MQRRLLFRFSALTLAISLALFLGCESPSDHSGIGAGLALEDKEKGATQQKIPISFSVLDCHARLLSLSGRLHVVSHVREDKSDLYQVDLHGNFQGLTATDPAGETLAGGGAGKVSGTFDALPLTLTDTLQVALDSKNSGDALQVAFTVQYDIGADGEVTVIMYAPIAVCDPDGMAVDVAGAGAGRMGRSPFRFVWNPGTGWKPRTGE